MDSPLTNQHRGVGVGLPLTKRLVELHGGRLAIESQSGQGTTVRMILPRSSTSVTPTAASASKLAAESPSDMPKSASVG